MFLVALLGALFTNVGLHFLNHYENTDFSTPIMTFFNKNMQIAAYRCEKKKNITFISLKLGVCIET